ncbi:hypothetical protein XENTR_v10000625 [Xenopus tropicalis]|nr:hypothetical protein XENTR_v10000625 [Xenopus tropicalis]
MRIWHCMIPAFNGDMVILCHYRNRSVDLHFYKTQVTTEGGPTNYDISEMGVVARVTNLRDFILFQHV